MFYVESGNQYYCCRGMGKRALAIRQFLNSGFAFNAAVKFLLVLEDGPHVRGSRGAHKSKTL